MPTSPRGRTQERERWGERHPRLARTVNGAGVLVAFGAAAVLYGAGDVVTAGAAAVLGVVLVVGVVWPRFGALSVVLDLLALA